MNGPNDADPRDPDSDLPEPETEVIKNFAGLPQWIRDAIPEGLFVAIEGQGVHDSAIRVGTLSGLLTHFNKLFRVVQAKQCGVEVNRRGRLADIPGGRELEALPAMQSSYALPLRLQAPEGELVGQEYSELQALVALLSPEVDLKEHLSEMPERVGDELHELFHVLASGNADLRIERVHESQAVEVVRINADDAQRKAAWLAEESEHDLGTYSLRGKLFRIDTKNSEIRVDVLQEDGDSSIEKASYKEDQFEDLRDALDHQVEIEVGLIEERRPYERTARTRKLNVIAIRRLDDGESGPDPESSESA